mmetsp:Transcript_6096/g.18586  ORF Transcript_6096/g.18586 Transcript_6096/m.18586 type:complete len:495 (+) Transcript_6096:2793-4277(+)
MIRKTGDEPTLDGQLLGEQVEIAGQLRVLCDDGRLAKGVELRATGTTKDLEHVEHAQLDKAALRRVVEPCALDDDCVRWQVHTPGQRGRAADHATLTLGEETLHQRAIGPQHARVMKAHAHGQEVAQTRVTHLLGATAAAALAGLGTAAREELELAGLFGHLEQHLCGADGLLAAVHKDHGLVAFAQRLADAIEAGLVGVLEALHGVACTHADELLLQRHRPVGGAKVVETALAHAQELGHVAVVGQRSAEAHDADHHLRALHQPQRARHQALDHRAAVLVQQVHLVDDEQAHQRGQRPVRALARDHVPLLGRGHDHVRLVELAPAQLHVAGELAHLHTERAQPPPKGGRHLGGERLHGRHVHDLEVVAALRRQTARLLVHVLRQLAQHCAHGHVGLAGAGGRTHQQVLVAVEGRLPHLALHAVQLAVALEGQLRPRGQRLDAQEVRSAPLLGGQLLGGHGHLLELLGGQVLCGRRQRRVHLVQLLRGATLALR